MSESSFAENFEDLEYISTETASERRQHALALSRGIESLNKKLRAKS